MKLIVHTNIDRNPRFNFQKYDCYVTKPRMSESILKCVRERDSSALLAWICIVRDKRL